MAAVTRRRLPLLLRSVLPALSLAMLLAHLLPRAGRCADAAPRAAIRDLAADTVVYPVIDGVPIVLPPGSDHFRIRYDATALDSPDTVRFEFCLDGVDRRWMEAGTRRATSYTNIGPGTYTFRVRALAPGSRVPGPEARLTLRVAPTLTQSLEFRLAGGAAIGLLVALLYRYRVRIVSGRVAARLQVRTAERDRIARTLHDTFLQTVQGLVLRVDAVAATLPPDDRARRQLENVLDDASQAIGEGRDRLQELRAGDAAILDLHLERMLADAIARLRGLHPHGTREPAIELRVEGTRRPLAPAVSDDIAALAREALRNAWAHAHAARIRLVLGYGRRALTLSVSDDGWGIPPSILDASGAGGHAGLTGMRESAARLGGHLEIDSGPRQGTTVTLTVPDL
jgi:signal transduction histidine kinase